MKVVLDVKDHKMAFFMEMIQKYQDFITLDNPVTVTFDADGTALSETDYIESVLQSAKSPKSTLISTENLMHQLDL
jgi:hypothetical protein